MMMPNKEYKFIKLPPHLLKRLGALKEDVKISQENFVKKLVQSLQDSMNPDEKVLNTADEFIKTSEKQPGYCKACLIFLLT